MPPILVHCLFPRSGSTQSSCLLLRWSCLRLEAKRVLTLNQAKSYPSQNPGLSGAEISKGQIWTKNIDFTLNPSPLASWRLEAEINDRLCLHL